MWYRSSGNFTATRINNKEIGARKAERLSEALEELALEVTETSSHHVEGDFSDIKFYYVEDDAKALSRKFKNILFHFEVHGEDAEDVWDFFALNGKVQSRYARVIRYSRPKKELWK